MNIERENVVEGQRHGHHLGLGFEQLRHVVENLPHVRTEVAVTQHRPLGNSGGTAGVLQHQKRVAVNRHMAHWLLAAR